MKDDKLEDKLMKYSWSCYSKQLHRYLKLKGEYKCAYPTDIITCNNQNLQMDCLYALTNEMMNNVEHQSTPTGESDLNRYDIYSIYSERNFCKKVNNYVVVSCDVGKCLKTLKITESRSIYPKYIDLTKINISKRLNKLQYKVENNMELSEDESLDLVFLPLAAKKIRKHH